MPKELIRDAITDGFRAQVGWVGIAGEDSGYVQVATVNENSTLQLDDPLPEGRRRRRSRAGLCTSTGRD